MADEIVPIPNRRSSGILNFRFVHIHLQFKFSLIVFTLLSLSALISWVITKGTVSALISDGQITANHVLASLRVVNGVIIQTSILVFVVTFLLAVFFSHYVAGPIYRFEKILEEMREGNLNLFVRLREKDEFKDTAALFNEALASLRERVSKERTGVQESVLKLQALSDDLKAAGHSDESRQLVHLVEEIRNLPPQIKI